MKANRLAPLFLLVAACGGGTTDPAPPPPPPPPPTPTSLSLNAGDGQEAAPGAALATAPSVIVRGANGTPVPNVSVAFAVDSGGGSIANATATTNASGIASPGAWTVGAAEGPQVLIASVSGLAPLKIRALSRIATTTIAGGTITSTGGTITVSRPGQPLDGLTLTIPAGAVATAGAVTLSVTSTAGMTFKRGITPASAGLLITATAGALTKPALVRFPTSGPADPNIVLMVHNPRTGESNVLLQQVPGQTSFGALLPALDASIIPLPAGAAAPAGLLRGPFPAAVADDPILLTLARIPPEALSRDYPPQFLAQRDNWDFTNFAVAWLPFLAGADESDRQERMIDIGSGMIATSLWYFKNQRGTPPLYKRFRLQPDKAASNKVGIRWAALANDYTEANFSVQWSELKELYEDRPASTFHWGQFQMLKQAFYFADDRPIPILLYTVADLPNLPDNVELEPEMAIATGIVGNKIHVVVPFDDMITYELTVTEEGGLVPERMFLAGGETITIRSWLPVLERPLIERPGVAANWPKVLNETVGDAEGWPSLELHWNKGELDPDKVCLAEPLTQWWECPRCPDFGIALPGTPEAAKKLQGFNFLRIVNGSMDALPERVARSTLRWSADSVESDVDPTRTGHLIVLVQSETEVQGRFAAGWLDWQTVEFRKIALNSSPESVTFSKDTTVTFLLDPSQPFPPGTTFSWVLRTEDGRDSIATAGPTHSRELEAGTDGMMLIIAHEKDSKRPIARDSVKIEPVEAEPYWRLTTIADSDNLIDLGIPGQSGELYDVLVRVLAAPGAGIIAIDGTLPNASVSLRVLPGATWTVDNCCSATPLPGELKQLLGVMPPVASGVGPHFAGWEQSRWSQTTTNLNSGTLTGQYIMGTISYDIEDVGTQVGPRGDIRITATRNGKIMTGTIAITGWWVDDETGELDSPPDTYSFPFTAERIR